jgi:hypothetical protein
MATKLATGRQALLLLSLELRPTPMAPSHMRALWLALQISDVVRSTRRPEIRHRRCGRSVARLLFVSCSMLCPQPSNSVVSGASIESGG